jgi:signal transduction histidine kinase
MVKLSGTIRVLAASGLVGVALIVLGWLDYRATRAELVSLLRDQALTLRQTIAAAARSNQAAGAQAEAQVAARLLDNARFFAEIDRHRALDQKTLADLTDRNRLFRVTVIGPDGARELASGRIGPGGGRGLGPGPGGGAGLGPGPGEGTGARPGGGLGRGPGLGPGFGLGPVVEEALKSEQQEGVVGLHTTRWGTSARLSAWIKRPRGGVIVLNVDATEVANLQRQASLDGLVADIVASAGEVAYVTLEGDGVGIAHGDVPAALAAPNVPAAGEKAPDTAGPPQAAERELSVDGRPVLEFSGPIELGGKDSGLLRLGLRLDGLRHAQQRMLWRVSLSLAAALALAMLALGTIWLRHQLGVVSEKHARAEAALRRRDRLAAMGELASTVAHEVRNPLNAIAMSAQRLRREFFQGSPTPPGTDRDELSQLLGVVEAETGRIDHIVQQFLEFARPPKLTPRRSALGPEVSSVVDLARSLAESRGVSLDVDATGAGEAFVDPGQLRQALDNLIRNAIDATPAGGTVRVTARSGARGHFIDVVDTGKGIAPEDLPRIFDLYFTTKPDGTGVGLAVTQQIVSAHSGTIEVDSKPGEGTRMTIWLPSSPEESTRG